MSADQKGFVERSDDTTEDESDETSGELCTLCRPRGICLLLCVRFSLFFSVALDLAIHTLAQQLSGRGTCGGWALLSVRYVAIILVSSISVACRRITCWDQQWCLTFIALFNSLYNMAYWYALPRLPLSHAVALRLGCRFITALLVSRCVLRERVSYLRFFAMFLCVCGMTLTVNSSMSARYVINGTSNHKAVNITNDSSVFVYAVDPTKDVQNSSYTVNSSLSELSSSRTEPVLLSLLLSELPRWSVYLVCIFGSACQGLAHVATRRLPEEQPFVISLWSSTIGLVPTLLLAIFAESQLDSATLKLDDILRLVFFAVANLSWVAILHGPLLVDSSVLVNLANNSVCIFALVLEQTVLKTVVPNNGYIGEIIGVTILYIGLTFLPVYVLAASSDLFHSLSNSSIEPEMEAQPILAESTDSSEPTPKPREARKSSAWTWLHQFGS